MLSLLRRLKSETVIQLSRSCDLEMSLVDLWLPVDNTSLYWVTCAAGDNCN